MHERFRYRNADEIIGKAKELGFDLPFSNDLSPLLGPLTIDGFSIRNRFVVQPMEGYDSEPDGSPSPLTKRRYLRYAEGGSGIIWFEATAVSADGRSNPGQPMITSGNLEFYRSLVYETRMAASKKGFNPILVIQLTHSGRYSKPGGKSTPKVAALNPVLDITEPYILTDSDLRQIRDQYISSAKLASEAGFDAIDIKACHGYLIHELLSSKERKGSIYGGPEPFKRFRFLLETLDRIKTEVPGIILTCRLNVYDAYTGGFGTGEDGKTIDLTEPEILIAELRLRGIRLLNITMGSPYYNPYIVRPFNSLIPGTQVPDEHPLTGVMRMIKGTARLQKKFPEMQIVGSAYSYLRQYAPNVAAAVIDNQDATLIGFGRSSFAYPSLPDDLMNKGFADPEKVCITCSGCSRLIANLRPGGCVIHDREIYGNELKKLIADGKG